MVLPAGGSRPRGTPGAGGAWHSRTTPGPSLSLLLARLHRPRRRAPVAGAPGGGPRSCRRRHSRRHSRLPAAGRRGKTLHGAHLLHGTDRGAHPRSPRRPLGKRIAAAGGHTPHLVLGSVRYNGEDAAMEPSRLLCPGAGRAWFGRRVGRTRVRKRKRPPRAASATVSRDEDGGEDGTCGFRMLLRLWRGGGAGSAARWAPSVQTRSRRRVDAARSAAERATHLPGHEDTGGHRAVASAERGGGRREDVEETDPGACGSWELKGLLRRCVWEVRTRDSVKWPRGGHW